MNRLIALILFLSISLLTLAQTPLRRNAMTNLPPGYWPLEKSQAIVDKTQTIRLSPALSQLSEGERKAVEKLLEVGQLFQSIYEEQRHAQAASSLRDLQLLDKRNGSTAATQNLLTLYRLNQGPIAATLENKREAFLPANPPAPEKNVYPRGVTKEMVEAFLSGHPEKRDELMDSRTVVRRVDPVSLQRDLAALRKYPVLDTLHPQLREVESLLRGAMLPKKLTLQRAPVKRRGPCAVVLSMPCLIRLPTPMSC